MNFKAQRIDENDIHEAVRGVLPLPGRTRLYEITQVSLGCLVECLGCRLNVAVSKCQLWFDPLVVKNEGADVCKKVD